MKPVVQRAGWRIILGTEAARLWRGWRGPALLLAFAVFLSVYTVLLAMDPEMNILSPRQMIHQILQATLFGGILPVLLLSANSISGERDRRSLESLLLAPLPGRQIAAGKFMAALSVWPGILAISIPYLLLTAKGTGASGQAVGLLLLPASVLVLLAGAIGTLISSVARSNLASFSMSFLFLIVLAAPTQLPRSVQDLPLLHWLLLLNPVTAIACFQSEILSGTSLAQAWSWLVSPILVLLLIGALSPKFLDQHLSLLGGLRE